MRLQLSISRTLVFIMLALIAMIAISCDTTEAPEPQQSQSTNGTVTGTPVNPNDTLVKFTLYSNRVPYIWKRMVKSVWVQDTIKVNSVIRYEPFDKKHFGYGYWVTMNLAGQVTDSLHIKAEYKGKMTEKASLKGQSAAYVLLDDVKP